METVLIKAANKSDAALLVALAKKLGMATRTLTQTEIEDWQLAQKIESGLKSGEASRNAIMEELEDVRLFDKAKDDGDTPVPLDEAFREIEENRSKRH